MSKSLFSVTPDPLTGGGIFSALQSLDPPWVDEDIALQLDMSYYGNISGGKVVSPLIDRILTASKLSTADMTTLAGVIMAINKDRWSREWATRSAEYNPIENYRMTEEMTDDETVTEYGRSHTRTDNLYHTETRTDNLTRTIDNQEITTPNLTSTSQQATRGFNSNSDVNTDKETATNTGTNRVDTDGTEHNTGTQGTTGSNTGTQTDADTGSDTSTRNYTLTRSGNIGVTTSQQMLQSERDLWMWSYFYDVVFPDVDDVLTIPVYAEGEETDETGGGIIPTGIISIVENGNYDVTTYARANVSVPLPSGAVNITTNGRHNVTSYEYADVLVPNTYTESDEGKVVSSGALVAQTSREITANGVYDTTLNNSIDVDVISYQVMTQQEWDSLTFEEQKAAGLVLIGSTIAGVYYDYSTLTSLYQINTDYDNVVDLFNGDGYTFHGFYSLVSGDRCVLNGRGGTFSTSGRRFICAGQNANGYSFMAAFALTQAELAATDTSYYDIMKVSGYDLYVGGNMNGAWRNNYNVTFTHDGTSQNLSTLFNSSTFLLNATTIANNEVTFSNEHSSLFKSIINFLSDD